MLKDKTVLVVEDNVYLALDLCAAIQQLDGRPLGPVYSVADAMAVLDNEVVTAAILDWELPGGDVIRLAEALSNRGVPFVLQATSEMPPKSAAASSHAPVLIKPIRPHDVASTLASEIAKAQDRS